MNSTPPPSNAGVPSGGNGTYIAVAVVLLLGIGGLVAYKLKGSEQPQAKPVAIASASATATPHFDPTDSIPPPPPVEDASVDAAPAVINTTGPATAVNLCDTKTCNGTLSTGLENGLNMVARQTRKRCYERALGNDPALHGKITVRLKISANGQVCSSSVGSNDMSDPSVAQCAASSFRGSLAPPTGGCVNIDFPIKYEPAAGH